MNMLSFEDVRKQCRLGRSTLRRLVSEGRFPAPHAGEEWRQSDVNRWLRERSKEAVEVAEEPEAEAEADIETEGE